ncbi:Angiopoietin-1 [Holothuria leucospilota]|uniref:Fibrinogen-like protein 1 n=1 Tax=Holothuria leucospilota TaxID=206669 RepID=A0A9Q1BW99_HOLLE|nr:Angiopoietin-1 [Holothuria leucospilota]
MNNQNSVDQSSYFFYQRPEYPRDCEEVRNQCSSGAASGVYLIKPDGYSEPFEIYCDNVNSEAWTVLLRRNDERLNFDRIWNEYRDGFGFLSQEFWIGNEKLSYLTNQKNYELRINITYADGSSCYVNYDLFRTTDDFGSYKITKLGQFSGNADDCLPVCDCSCQKTCANLSVCLNTCNADIACVCSDGFYLKGEDCVPLAECSTCEVDGATIPEGGFYVNSDCTSRADCLNGQLIWDVTYSCSANAVCESRNNIRQCYTDDVDCLDVYNDGFTSSDVYTINPTNWPGSAFQVYCNMSDGGGWTVFQRRVDGTVDFYRNWTSYKEGFGSFDHEHWLGNDKLYYLTNQKRYTIRIDLVNLDGDPYYAKYDYFRVNDENDNYRLSQVGLTVVLQMNVAAATLMPVIL